MPVEFPLVVALDLPALAQPQSRELVIAPIPAQGAIDVWLIAVGLPPVAEVHCQHVRLVAMRAQVRHG